jgi:nucleotide-binding universal stress UspA family protein
VFPVRTILHPTDFSDRSRAAFEVASSLARDQKAVLVVLHVNDEAGAFSTDQSQVRYLDEMLTR